jgi:hypothetical protein
MICGSFKEFFRKQRETASLDAIFFGYETLDKPRKSFIRNLKFPRVDSEKHRWFLEEKILTE